MQKYAPASNGNKNWKFYCEKCDYGCNRRFLMTQHEKTQKHQMLKNAQKCSSQVEDNSALHKCKCGKKYKHIQSFKRHVKNCKIAMDSQELVIEKSDKTTDESLEICYLLFPNNTRNMVIENAEMRKIVTEMILRIGNNNTTINNRNKTFKCS